jgi:hypothetical protein
MAEKVYLTNFVKEKKWDGGGSTLSFKLDQYFLDKLKTVPLGSYIQIQKKKDPKDDATHYVEALVNATPKPAQADNIPF